MKKISKIIKSDLPDLAEPFVDETMINLAKGLFGVVLPNLVNNLPVLRYVKTATDLYGAYRLDKLNRRLNCFLRSLLDGNFSLEDYKKLPKSEQEQIIDVMTTELDNQSDERQAEALGYLFNAYILGKINNLMFIGISHELKNTNPLVFYFNVDSFKTTKFGKDAISIQIEGPIHYLPNSFVSNANEAFVFSSNLLLTNLGKVFFEFIYEPMAKKYMI